MGISLGAAHASPVLRVQGQGARAFTRTLLSKTQVLSVLESRGFRLPHLDTFTSRAAHTPTTLTAARAQHALRTALTTATQQQDFLPAVDVAIEHFIQLKHEHAEASRNVAGHAAGLAINLLGLAHTQAHARGPLEHMSSERLSAVQYLYEAAHLEVVRAPYLAIGPVSARARAMELTDHATRVALTEDAPAFAEALQDSSYLTQRRNPHHPWAEHMVHNNTIQGANNITRLSDTEVAMQWQLVSALHLLRGGIATLVDILPRAHTSTHLRATSFAQVVDCPPSLVWNHDWAGVPLDIDLRASHQLDADGALALSAIQESAGDILLLLSGFQLLGSNAQSIASRYSAASCYSRAHAHAVHALHSTPHDPASSADYLNTLQRKRFFATPK